MEAYEGESDIFGLEEKQFLQTQDSFFSPETCQRKCVLRL